MCSYIPDHVRASLEQAFRRLDRNGDGTITIREFRIACAQVNPSISEKEIKNLVINVSCLCCFRANQLLFLKTDTDDEHDV